jgi:hypothetical protein
MSPVTFTLDKDGVHWWGRHHSRKYAVGLVQDIRPLNGKFRAGSISSKNKRAYKDFDDMAEARQFVMDRLIATDVVWC